MKNHKKTIATLTKDEKETYACAFWTYLGNVRNDSKRADRYAWRETVKAFPRLAAFEGAKP